MEQESLGPFLRYKICLDIFVSQLKLKETQGIVGEAVQVVSFVSELNLMKRSINVTSDHFSSASIKFYNE